MESNESPHNRYEVGDEEATVAVVTAVAQEEGRDPLDLPPLYGTIDPDVLEAVARSEVGDEYWVAFSYCGYRVEVKSTGTVTVTP
ncbi:hypothetical protein SAMN04488063_0280 [Halopelagius inordinatus]|uniref:Halobacterial output domain-containing protein n=1 Tax=Halopelagius inordinatus TaxID=553467 RepID=A0A1I2LN70_9EURY|nr:HalOD1 output domain-containing protein [Halopelagius inordinatus]SFF78491.1 hypothetical protein SAMN04488063_0280 [Halopelagius inordinatus]